MVSSQIRQEARTSLTGKWGKAAILTLIYAVIVYIVSFVLNIVPVFGSIANALLDVAFTYGLLKSFMKLKRGEEISYIDFLKEGFPVYGKLWGIIGNTLLKLIVPIVVAIVGFVVMFIGIGSSAASMLSSTSTVSSASLSGVAVVGMLIYIVGIIWCVIKGFYYSLTSYLLVDNEDMSAKDIVAKSEELMQGNRWAYFWLPITFIGWFILCGFTLGIGSLWLIPYLQVAQIVFYEDRAGILGKKETVEPVDTAE